MRDRQCALKHDAIESAPIVPGLSCGDVCVILRLAVLAELRIVTDGQTDTDRHRPTMASTADA